MGLAPRDVRMVVISDSKQKVQYFSEVKLISLVLVFFYQSLCLANDIAVKKVSLHKIIIEKAR